MNTVLLLVALELLTGRDAPDCGEPAPGDHVAVAMVPLGTPLLAGPGAIVARRSCSSPRARTSPITR